MKRLFVGGTNDGERLDDFDGRQIVVALKKQSTKPFFYRGDPTFCPAHEHEEYRRELITGARETFVFYVESSMHIDDAISMLITGYKSNAHLNGGEAVRSK